MATTNIGILTTAGKSLVDRVNSGATKVTYTKIVFSSMDNSTLTDEQVKALTSIEPQEVLVNNPDTILDAKTGETRIRGNGTNEILSNGVYVKTYAVYAKDSEGNEILYGITISDHPNYLAAFDGLTPQAITYTYHTKIDQTTNIVFSNSTDVYVTDQDLKESISVLETEINSKSDDAKVLHLHDAYPQVLGTGKSFDLDTSGLAINDYPRFKAWGYYDGAGIAQTAAYFGVPRMFELVLTADLQNSGQTMIPRLLSQQIKDTLPEFDTASYTTNRASDGKWMYLISGPATIGIQCLNAIFK